MSKKIIEKVIKAEVPALVEAKKTLGNTFGPAGELVKSVTEMGDVKSTAVNGVLRGVWVDDFAVEPQGKITITDTSAHSFFLGKGYVAADVGLDDGTTAIVNDILRAMSYTAMQALGGKVLSLYCLETPAHSVQILMDDASYVSYNVIKDDGYLDGMVTKEVAQAIVVNSSLVRVSFSGKDNYIADTRSDETSFTGRNHICCERKERTYDFTFGSMFEHAMPGVRNYYHDNAQFNTIDNCNISECNLNHVNLEKLYMKGSVIVFSSIKASAHGNVIRSRILLSAIQANLVRVSGTDLNIACTDTKSVTVNGAVVTGTYLNTKESIDVRSSIEYSAFTVLDVTDYFHLVGTESGLCLCAPYGHIDGGYGNTHIVFPLTATAFEVRDQLDKALVERSYFKGDDPISKSMMRYLANTISTRLQLISTVRSAMRVNNLVRPEVEHLPF